MNRKHLVTLGCLSLATVVALPAWARPNAKTAAAATTTDAPAETGPSTVSRYRVEVAPLTEAVKAWNDAWKSENSEGMKMADAQIKSWVDRLQAEQRRVSTVSKDAIGSERSNRPQSSREAAATTKPKPTTADKTTTKPKGRTVTTTQAPADTPRKTASTNSGYRDRTRPTVEEPAGPQPTMSLDPTRTLSIVDQLLAMQPRFVAADTTPDEFAEKSKLLRQLEQNARRELAEGDE